MIDLGTHIVESYAHILNVDRSITRLNPIIEKFGYRFLWVDAAEFERDFSEILNVPKSNDRLLTIIIGKEQHRISHELHNALIHTPVFGPEFMHMEHPGLILLQKLANYKITGGFKDFLIESKEFKNFYPVVSDLLLQLRLFKSGEIRCSQLFNITSISRQISWRKMEISIGSSGDFIINDEDIEKLSDTLKAKYECNILTELAIKNFSVVYDLPDGRIRFITQMTCLESLFNMGKDQIAHTIARHLSIILSETQEQFKVNYSKIKKLYNMRNGIVHGGEYKGDLIPDYLDLCEKVRKAITYCNSPKLTKEKLFDDLNTRGF
jgi:hypothetical protein